MKILEYIDDAHINEFDMTSWDWQEGEKPRAWIRRVGFEDRESDAFGSTIWRHVTAYRAKSEPGHPWYALVELYALESEGHMTIPPFVVRGPVALINLLRYLAPLIALDSHAEFVALADELREYVKNEAPRR